MGPFRRLGSFEFLFRRPRFRSFLGRIRVRVHRFGSFPVQYWSFSSFGVQSFLRSIRSFAFDRPFPNFIYQAQQNKSIIVHSIVITELYNEPYDY